MMQAADISSPDLSDILSLDGDPQLLPLGDGIRNPLSSESIGGKFAFADGRNGQAQN